jgi:molybdenum cofactor cytidylyltransferase
LRGVGCVLLAAGISVRMGEPKLLAQVRGRTVLEMTLANHMASSLDVICAVVAGWIDGLKELAQRQWPPRATFVEIARPCPMSETLKTGWRWLMDNAGPDAVMISLGDQPLVTARTINRLIEAYQASDLPICVPIYKGSWGHPVIISSEFGGDVMRLEGDRGAKPILMANHDRIETVEVDSDEVVTDLDSIETLRTLRKRLGTDG